MKIHTFKNWKELKLFENGDIFIIPQCDAYDILFHLNKHVQPIKLITNKKWYNPISWFKKYWALVVLE